MAQTLGGGGPLIRVVLEHRRKEVGELAGRVRLPAVLLGEHVVQVPRLQADDVAQFALLVEVVARLLAGVDDRLGNVAQQLDDVRQMVLVARVPVARVRLEQVVAGRQLEGHAGDAPHVGRGAVAGADQHLQRPVLARLYVLGEVLVRPAGVAQVRHLDAHLLARLLRRVEAVARRLHRTLMQLLGLGEGDVVLGAAVAEHVRGQVDVRGGAVAREVRFRGRGILWNPQLRNRTGY